MAATTVANLVVQVSASAEKLKTDLKSAEGTVTGFASNAGKVLAGIGIAVGTAVVAAGLGIAKMVTDTAKQLDDLGDSAGNLGIATKELQRLQFQAGQAGSSAEGVGQSLMFMQNAIQDAVDGNEQLVKTFQTLGLDAKNLKSLKPEEQFRKIADAMKRVTDQSQGVQLARNLFGRGGFEQLNLLRSNLEETSKQFDKLGLGASDSQLSNVDAFDKSSKAVSAIWEDFKQKVAGDSIPAFTMISEAIIKVIADMGGVGNIATKTASIIVSAVENMVKAINFISPAIGVVKQAWLGLQLLGQATQNTLLKSQAKLAAPQAEIDEMRKDPFTPNWLIPKKSQEEFQKELLDSNSAIDETAAAIMKLHNESQVQEKTPLLDGLTKLRLELDGVSAAAEKAKESIGKVGTGSGWIKNEATGEIMTVGQGGNNLLNSDLGTGTGGSFSNTNMPGAGQGAIWSEENKDKSFTININTNSKYLEFVSNQVKLEVNRSAVVDPGI